VKKSWIVLIICVFAVIGIGFALNYWLTERNSEPVSPGATTPSRIVSLANSATEILFMLGAGDKIVGVSSTADYPPEVKSKSTVGKSYGSVNLELVLGKNPDLVICSKSNAHLFEEKGISTFVVTTMDLEGVIKLVEDLGNLVGKEAEATEIAGDMRRRIDEVKSKVESVPGRPLVYFEDSSLGKTRSRGSLTDELIRAAGGVNIARNETVPFPILSAEFIISENPDVIIIEEYGGSIEELKSRDGWRNISAVKNNRVYKSPVYFTNYTPRCVDGLEQYARWIHPEIFEE